MTNKPNAPSKHKQPVQASNLDILISFFSRERTRISKQVDKADGDASVDVQDKGIFLRCGHFLDGESVIEEGVAGEVLLDVFFDELDTQVRVVHRLNLMANTTD